MFMKPLLGASLLVLLAASGAVAQDAKLYSNPPLPSREVLDRLHLRMAWSVNVPMDGRRDGFISVQLNNGQIVAATRSGVVAIFDAETGRPIWKVVAGKPYDTTFAPTMNSKSVLVVNGIRVLALNRNTGAEQWQ